MHEGVIVIGRREIGDGRPCFVIAEAGVNHNGQKDLALALVDAAAQAGADCVKFQTFAAERVASAVADKAPYQTETTRSGGSQIEMLRALELPEDAYPDIIAACRARGLIFLSTPYSYEDADFLLRLDVAAFKVASAQIVELDFLRYLAQTGKPIILSTGMATLAEIDDAVRAVRQAGGTQLVLMQCTTNYPSTAQDANLRVVQALRRSFGTLVGYSDHTATPACCLVAVALGSVAIEKHLTLDKTMKGPDHVASADPREFCDLVDLIRQAEAALGTGRKEPVASELANRPFMRRSIVARVPIPSGAVITSEALAFKRPGTGISPARLGEVLGARARSSIELDEMIQWADLER